jgi:hypothetical protein
MGPDYIIYHNLFKSSLFEIIFFQKIRYHVYVHKITISAIFSSFPKSHAHRVLLSLCLKNQ